MMKTIFPLTLIILVLFSFSPADRGVEIKVDASRTVGELQPFWASQIIHPTEFLRSEWGREFAQLLAETGAARQFIRIYNQPEYAVRIDSGGNVSFDWSHFDEMAEIIISTGNKLQVVFFAMVPEWAKYPDSKRERPYGAIVHTSPPRDYQLWEELVSDFMRHVLQKYGLEEIKQWLFRCWNEPDLGGFWHQADLNEYLKLYDHFAKAAKAVHEEIRIGGPALSSTRTWNNPENFTFFLDHIVNGKNHATGETGSPIDFLDIHTYGGTRSRGGPGRDFPDIDYMLEQQMRYADMRDQYPALRHVPIHVFEWGVAASGARGVDIEPMADFRNSQYGAAFLATLVDRHIRIQTENDRHIKSFTFCASGYERLRERNFMGFRTLHTKDGFHKPILNAYKLLDKLSDELVAVTIERPHEHVSSYATRDADRISIVAVNFQHDKIFHTGPTYSVTLQLESDWSPDTNVSVRHWRIDETHSNAYTTYRRIGSPLILNPLEIDAVKNRMHLEQLETPVEMPWEEAQNLQFELPCNAVSLIEIIRNSR